MVIFIVLLDFNSIKVRLERALDPSCSDSERHFNSIKVRLEPKYEAERYVKRPVFQFHKGAIRTRAEGKNAPNAFISIP